MNEILASHIVWARAPTGQRRPAARRKPQRQRPLFNGQALRDTVLFLAGLALLYHQAELVPEPSEVLVAAALALIFGPIPLRLDESRKNGANGS